MQRRRMRQRHGPGSGRVGHPPVLRHPSAQPTEDARHLACFTAARARRAAGEARVDRDTARCARCRTSRVARRTGSPRDRSRYPRRPEPSGGRASGYELHRAAGMTQPMLRDDRGRRQRLIVTIVLPDIEAAHGIVRFAGRPPSGVTARSWSSARTRSAGVPARRNYTRSSSGFRYLRERMPPLVASGRRCRRGRARRQRGQGIVQNRGHASAARPHRQWRVARSTARRETSHPAILTPFHRVPRRSLPASWHAPQFAAASGEAWS